jgi:hypothetical protein
MKLDGGQIRNVRRDCQCNGLASFQIGGIPRIRTNKANWQPSRGVAGEWGAGGNNRFSIRAKIKVLNIENWLLD